MGSCIPSVPSRPIRRTGSRFEIYNRQSSARPALAGEPLDVETYDVVYLGYPIWTDQIPGAVYSFLERYDLSGKTIVPFCTYEEGTTDSTYAAIAAAEPEAEVIQSGFFILPEEMPEARAYLSVWLERAVIHWRRSRWDRGRSRAERRKIDSRQGG